MNKVKEVREGIGMSQTELARRARMASQNLCAIENERVVPWPKAKRSLARVLKKSIPELFPNGEERVS